MYRVEKRFTVPIGHRLSKHAGRCKNIHGHNLVILVGLKTTSLNLNDMVMDFSDLKKMVGELIDEWDHAVLINNIDKDLNDTFEFANMRCITFPFDPTAERLSEVLYNAIESRIPLPTQMDYVTIFENENSKATFTVE